MIKLTEIYSLDRKEDLKEIYVNPAFIVMMRNDDELNQRHARKPLIDNLNPSIGFTKLILNTGMDNFTDISVVGDMKHVKEKMEITK